MKESLFNNSFLTRIAFISEETIASGGGISTAMSYVNGVGVFNGSSSKITYNKVFPIKSIRIKFKPSTTTQNIVKLTSSHSISCSAGTLSATGFSSPTIYKNGNVSSTITTNWNDVVITTATNINANAFIIGYISAYYTGQIELIEIYNYTLSAQEVSNLYNNRRYKQLSQHGEILGPELVTNGSFSSGSGWTLNDATISGGYLNINTVTISKDVAITTPAYSLVINKKYKVTYTIVSYTSGSIRMLLGSSGNATPILNSAGTYTTYVNLGSSPSNYILFYSWTGGFNGVIDNLSVREVLTTASPILSIDAYTGTIQNRLSGGKVNGVSVPFVTPTDVTVRKENGINVMYFNGSTSKIDAGSYNGLTDDISFVYVGKFSSYGEGGVGRLIDNGKLKIYITSTNNRLAVTSDGSTTIYSANNSILIGVPYIIIVRRKSDGKATIWIGSKNSSIALSGTADQASGTPATGTTNITLGNDNTSAYTLFGVSKEFTLYSGILSDVECSQLQTSNLNKL